MKVTKLGKITRLVIHFCCELCGCEFEATKHDILLKKVQVSVGETYDYNYGYREYNIYTTKCPCCFKICKGTGRYETVTLPEKEVCVYHE